MFQELFNRGENEHNSQTSFLIENVDDTEAFSSIQDIQVNTEKLLDTPEEKIFQEYF